MVVSVVSSDRLCILIVVCVLIAYLNICHLCPGLDTHDKMQAIEERRTPAFGLDGSRAPLVGPKSTERQTWFVYLQSLL